uniref:Reverse transcriptase Ty1/copia-type domain-containing protein n=1 Tax=Phytophthora ramorum TaxID=164328 RepID=H3G5Q8_PHYRM
FVCRLLRGLHGLRQTPNVWNRTLHTALQQLELLRLDSDYGLYTQQVGDTGEISHILTV